MVCVSPATTAVVTLALAAALSASAVEQSVQFLQAALSASAVSLAVTVETETATGYTS
jgi:hypothetical protein